MTKFVYWGFVMYKIKHLLYGTIFEKIDVTLVENRDFSHGDFRSLNLFGLRFINCKFDQANFAFSCMQMATFEKCSFINADFNSANFEQSTFKNCVMDGSIGINTKFHKSVMNSVTFNSVNLLKADFSEVNGEHLVFHNSDLSESNFDGAILANCAFHFSKIDKTSFVGTYNEPGTFKETSFKECDFSKSHWVRSMVVGCDLSKSTWNGFLMRSGVLSAVDMSHGNMDRTSFVNVEIQAVNMSSSNSTNLIFDNCLTHSIDLSESTIDGGYLGFYRPDATSVFYKADMKNTRYTGNIYFPHNHCFMIHNADGMQLNGIPVPEKTHLIRITIIGETPMYSMASPNGIVYRYGQNDYDIDGIINICEEHGIDRKEMDILYRIFGDRIA